MELIVKDLDNGNSNVWHSGKVIRCNDTITFPPNTDVSFNNQRARLMVPNNAQGNLKVVSSSNVKRR